jgi:hypothetical protein
MQRAKMFPRVCVLAIALAVAGLGAAPVWGADYPAGALYGQSCGIIIMAEGNIFTTWVEGATTCSFPPHTWVLAGNVFSSAGRGAPGPLVGICQSYQALSANGDWFQLSGPDGNDGCHSATASFLGNVFELTGMGVPGEKFATFGGRSSGEAEYAATTYGNVYRWDGCPGSVSNWSYIGAIAGGPTNATRRSWGELKQIYR